ncbi:MAG: LysR family transcriptional regulator [Pseudomonadota bacterium]
MNENLVRIDVNLIVTLHALLTTKSVSRAAEQIIRTQPATSHALARLREHFGDPILVRNGWSMELTAFAESLQGPVEQAVRQLDTVLNTGHRFDAATSTRTIRVATRDIGVSLFSRFVARVQAAAPKMCVQFVSTDDYPAAVLRAEADVALGFGRETQDASLHYQRMPPLHFAVFAPAQHPFADKPTLARWRRAHHVGVGGSGHGKGPVEAAAAKRGITRHFATVAPTFLSALSLVADCNALLTSLSAPLSTQARALGLQERRCPLPIPDAEAYLLTREPYGNPFELWLRAELTAAFNEQ